MILPVTEAGRVRMVEDLRQYGQHEQRLANALYVVDPDDVEHNDGERDARAAAADANAEVAEDCERLADKIAAGRPTLVNWLDIRVLDRVLDATYDDRPPAELAPVVEFIHDFQTRPIEPGENVQPLAGAKVPRSVAPLRSGNGAEGARVRAAVEELSPPGCPVRGATAG